MKKKYGSKRAYVSALRADHNSNGFGDQNRFRPFSAHSVGQTRENLPVNSILRRMAGKVLHERAPKKTDRRFSNKYNLTIDQVRALRADVMAYGALKNLADKFSIPYEYAVGVRHCRLLAKVIA